MNMHKANFLQTLGIAGLMAMSGSLTAQNFPATKETKKEIHTNFQNDSLKVVRGGFLAGADGELFQMLYYDEGNVPQEFKGGVICTAIPGQRHMIVFPYITKDTVIFVQKERIKSKKRTIKDFKIYYHLKTDPSKEVVRDRTYEPQNKQNKISRKDSTIHVLDEAEQKESFYKDAQGNVYTENDIVIDSYEDGSTTEVEDYYYGDQDVKSCLNTVYMVSNQLPVLSETGKKGLADCKAYLDKNPDKKISILAYNASKETNNIGCDVLLQRARSGGYLRADNYVDALALRNALKAHADKLIKVIQKEMGEAYKRQIEFVNAYDTYKEFSYPKGNDGKVYPAGSGFVIVYPKTEIATEEETIEETPDNIVDIQQQIIDLLCISMSGEAGYNSIAMGEITIRAVPNNAGIDKIYFHGEHILTVVRSNSLGAEETMKNIAIPVVSKETLIKARNSLEEAMLVYHYGGKEQKGYYLPMDPKYIRSLGKLVSSEGYQEPKVDPSNKLITVPQSEYMYSWKHSPNSFIQEYYCKSLTCELHNILVMNPEDCFKLIINPEEQGRRPVKKDPKIKLEKDRKKKEAEEKAKKEVELAALEAELAAIEKARLEAEAKAKEAARKQAEEAEKKIEMPTVVTSPRKTMNEEIGDIQQQILDLLCIAEIFPDVLEEDAISKVTVSDHPDNAALGNIYFNRQHILTFTKNPGPEGEKDINNVATPEVNKKLLIQTRKYLEETLNVYHYSFRGDVEQKGYYMPVNPKHIKFFFEKLTHESKNISDDDIPHGIPYSEYMDDWMEPKDGVPYTIAFQAVDYGQSTKSGRDYNYIPVINPDCRTPINNPKVVKKKAVEKPKEIVKKSETSKETLSEDELMRQILNLICLSGKLSEESFSIGEKLHVRMQYSTDKTEIGIYFKHKLLGTLIKDKAGDRTVLVGSLNVFRKANEYLQEELDLYPYGGDEQEGYYIAWKGNPGNPKDSDAEKIFLGKPKNCIEFHNSKDYAPNFPINLATFKKYTGLQPKEGATWDKLYCDNIPANIFFQKIKFSPVDSVEGDYTLVTKAENCFGSLNALEKQEEIKEEKEAELAAKEKARLEAEEAKKQAEEAKKQVDEAKKVREAEEQAEAKAKKEAGVKAKEEAEAKNVTHQDAERVRELMLRFLKVLECELSDNTGEAREARLRLKDAIGSDVKCILEYDPDISGVANNRNDHLQDANKTVTFKRKGKEYTLSMTFDPEHKAKLYDSRDGSKFEFETSDHEFAFWFGEKFGKNVYKTGTYDSETGKQDIKDATALLEEILKLNTCAENVQPQKTVPAELADKPKEEQAKPTKEEIKIKQEQIKKTEKEMNEIFEYGQKVIFRDNLSKFNRNNVEEGLDKLYDMLKKNPSLNIKVTGYYGGPHPTLPLERAEKVRDYLIRKGIDEERIQVAGGKEKIAKSIRIEIVE